MKLSWMSENRNFVEKLIKFANIYASIYNKEAYFGTDIMISFSQIQVVEYLLENEELNQNMSMIADRLGISPSNFTKLIHKLEAKKLLEKFNTENNKKNIIIRVTDTGRRVYQDYSDYIVKNYFSEIFEITSEIPQEFLSAFTRILEVKLKKCDLPSVTDTVTLIPLKKLTLDERERN
jgi:DNA-binding MarR family transcriptional regulator